MRLEDEKIADTPVEHPGREPGSTGQGDRMSEEQGIEVGKMNIELKR